MWTGPRREPNSLRNPAGCLRLLTINWDIWRHFREKWKDKSKNQVDEQQHSSSSRERTRESRAGIKGQADGRWRKQTAWGGGGGGSHGSREGVGSFHAGPVLPHFCGRWRSECVLGLLLLLPLNLSAPGPCSCCATPNQQYLLPLPNAASEGLTRENN